MVKKLLVIVVAAVGALAIQKKIKDQRAEQDLWAEATDDVRSTGPSGGLGDAAPAS